MAQKQIQLMEKDEYVVELFGFDRLNPGGIGPDGEFDNFPGVTYERRSSEIIFPVLEPFGENNTN